MVAYTRVPGTPLRIVKEPERLTPDEKLDEASREDADRVVPHPVRIRIGGGRTITASAMRARRVVQEIEEVGGAARPVSLEGEHATLEGEMDRDQAIHIARSPFVRRIERTDATD